MRLWPEHYSLSDQHGLHLNSVTRTEIKYRGLTAGFQKPPLPDRKQSHGDWPSSLLSQSLPLHTFHELAAGPKENCNRECSYRTGSLQPYKLRSHLLSSRHTPQLLPVKGGDIEERQSELLEGQQSKKHRQLSQTTQYQPIQADMGECSTELHLSGC